MSSHYINISDLIEFKTNLLINKGLIYNALI